MTTVIRPTFKATQEQLDAIERVKATWNERDRIEAQAWRETQELRDLDIPDLAICDAITQVTKPTLNRKLGPRKAREA